MGAGTGDPDLLPVKAVRVLRSAEVVLHDDTVSPEILELVPASAQVRKRAQARRAGGASAGGKSIYCSSRRRAEGHEVVRLKADHPRSSAHANEETEVSGASRRRFRGSFPGATSARGSSRRRDPLALSVRTILN